MKMGPQDSYICLIPKPLDQGPLLEDEDSHGDVTPEGPWSLLQSLTGSCLYVCPIYFFCSVIFDPQYIRSIAKAGSPIRTATMMKFGSLERLSRHNYDILVSVCHHLVFGPFTSVSGGKFLSRLF